jgi:ADP-ribose pyrophosphatase YjhB (NUDIX family)
MSGEITGAFGWLEEDGHVLLVANWRNLSGRDVLCWDLPGGRVEPGESLEEACVREMREETGLAVKVIDLVFVIERFGFRCDDPDRRSRYFFFHVERDGSGAVLRPEDPKIVDLGFRPIARLGDLCDQGYHRQIHDWLAAGRRHRYFIDRCASRTSAAAR